MADTIGGASPLPPEKLRSPVLRAHGREVAAHCFRRCYETWPGLNARYGARGREHVARDAFWHLEHLDAAVDDQLLGGPPRRNPGLRQHFLQPDSLSFVHQSWSTSNVSA